jgi:phenol/toluene 2-monooxygenase (NADH) P3/A3
MSAMKKLSLKDRYRILTRGLDWQTTHHTAEEVFPHAQFEGIKIHDWEGFVDPFRLTMDAYWKYQAEKERKLYAVLDSFQQNNGQTSISDARYVNVLKIWLTAIMPSEYQAHRGFSMLGRQFPNVGLRIAAQMQALDELRHAQTQVHSCSHYNKFFDGLHSFPQNYNRVWYLSVAKSFFDDARTAGPFEFLIAIGFAFEYVLTNLVFVPFMSGAAYNGDLSTVTFGFSAQSDESRHMTLGIEAIKFALEQDEANVPIIQHYIDKWFWRGYRLLSIVAMMMDYMLPKRIMSWQEAWEIYFNQAGGALFNDLARYGIRMPKFSDISNKESFRYSTEVWLTFYQFAHASGFHAWLPSEDELAWLGEKYGPEWQRLYLPRFKFFRELEEKGEHYYNPSLPQLCQVCQIPMLFTEPDDPTTICFRDTVWQGERYHFCSDGCQNVFEHEPEKYIHAWLPVHQIYQGHCGGATLPEVYKWWGFVEGADNYDYAGSPDETLWQEWQANRRRVGG